MTTINIYPQYDDALIGSSTDYATARGTGTDKSGFLPTYVGQQYSAPDYNILRGLMRFDTSVIPNDSVINSASLTMTVNSKFTDGGDFDVDIYKVDNWHEYYPFNASTSIDPAYDLLISGTKDDTLLNTAAASTNTTYTSTGLDPTWINAGGYTYYGLISSQDCSTGVPTGNEIITFYSINSPVPTSDMPLLTVDYTKIAPISYTVNFMWGSTEYSIDNEGSRMTRWALDRGREEIFSDSFNDYDIGELRIELDNYDGRYDPWNADSPLYGHITPGVKMRFRATYNGTVYTFFTGVLADVQLSGYRDKVVMQCKDGWRNLRDNDVSVGMTTDATFATAFNRALASTSYTYPWDLDISTSTDIPTYHWYDQGSIKGYIENIAFGSLGRAWVDVDGDFNFKALSDTDTAADTLSEDIMLKNVYLPMPWDNYKSKITLNGYELYYGEPESQFWIDYETNVRIYGDGETTSITKLRYSNTIPFLIDNPYPPVETTNPNITFELYDTTGGAIVVGDPEVDIQFESVGSTSAYLQITNSKVDSIYFYGLQYPYDSTDTPPLFNNPYTQVYDSTNTSMPDNEFTVDSSWLTVSPSTLATYEYDKERIADIGNTLLNYLSTIRAFPVIQMQGRYDKQFGLDLEDKVTLSFTTLNISGDYRISAISHESQVSPQDVITTFYLYPVMEKST